MSNKSAEEKDEKSDTSGGTDSIHPDKAGANQPAPSGDPKAGGFVRDFTARIKRIEDEVFKTAPGAVAPQKPIEASKNWLEAAIDWLEK